MSNMLGPSVSSARKTRRFAGNCYPSVGKKTIEEGFSFDAGGDLKELRTSVNYVRL